jgi:hypothetical protein
MQFVFVGLQPHEQFFSYLEAVTITGDRAASKFWPKLGTRGLWAGRDLYRATPTATRDLGLYGLIQKTGTHVPQWDSNPQRKDHQIKKPRKFLHLIFDNKGIDAVNINNILNHKNVQSWIPPSFKMKFTPCTSYRYICILSLLHPSYLITTKRCSA